MAKKKTKTFKYVYLTPDDVIPPSEYAPCVTFNRHGEFEYNVASFDGEYDKEVDVYDKDNKMIVRVKTLATKRFIDLLERAIWERAKTPDGVYRFYYNDVIGYAFNTVITVLLAEKVKRLLGGFDLKMSKPEMNKTLDNYCNALYSAAFLGYETYKRVSQSKKILDDYIKYVYSGMSYYGDILRNYRMSRSIYNDMYKVAQEIFLDGGDDEKIIEGLKNFRHSH